MLNIAVLVSGGGTNLQALIDAEKAGKIENGKISVVVASKPGVYALERAKNAGIEGIVLAHSDYENVAAYSEALENLLKEKHTDLIVLAGFMTITNEKFTKAFENKIINVHPALIPSFCGKGYYGLHVHEAALARGVKVSGATVHFVNEVCDGGPIILQKAVPVEQGDTPETLQRRIMEQAEWKILPQAVSLFCAGKLSVNGSIVTIKELFIPLHRKETDTWKFWILKRNLQATHTRAAASSSAKARTACMRSSRISLWAAA